MSKYAIFVDDGLWDVLDGKEEAKSIAADMRCALRAGGRKDTCYVRKLTKKEEREWAARGETGEVKPVQ